MITCHALSKTINKSIDVDIVSKSRQINKFIYIDE